MRNCNRPLNQTPLAAHMCVCALVSWCLQVKPGMPYLDVIRRLKESSHLPISAYHVSGEYAMMKAAVERGWLDERAAVLEVRTSVGVRGCATGCLPVYVYSPRVGCRDGVFVLSVPGVLERLRWMIFKLFPCS